MGEHVPPYAKGAELDQHIVQELGHLFTGVGLDAEHDSLHGREYVAGVLQVGLLLVDDLHELVELCGKFLALDGHVAQGFAQLLVLERGQLSAVEHLSVVEIGEEGKGPAVRQKACVALGPDDVLDVRQGVLVLLRERLGQHAHGCGLRHSNEFTV